MPRLRIFAGPNGSGKSTIKEVLSDELLGTYINPDEIEKEIKQYDFLDFYNYNIKTTKDEIIGFIEDSTLLKNVDMVEDSAYLKFNDNKLIFTNVMVNSYYASVCADFIRRKLCELQKSFTFETVMSSPDKIEFLKYAKESGYRIYLYFIATKDPLLNISRVENRVKKGGHSVPKEKIVKRYYRSLENLSEAVKYSDRAYIFDNSNHDRTWICEITDATEVEIKQESIPDWLNTYLFNK
jgi:predicted ABC-type ATPase